MLTTEYLKTLSPEEKQKKIIKEFIRCRKDPVYCIESYFSVLDSVINQRVPFKLYPHQLRAVKAFVEHPYNLTMKTRQMGLTTLSAAFVAWIMCTKQNQYISALAQEKLTSRKFLRQVRETLDYARKTAPWLVADYMFNNNGKDSFTLKTGCVIQAEANKPDAARGQVLDWLFIDEISSISHMSEIWSSAGLTLTKSQGHCIGVSCVTEDTFIFTPDGIKPIKSFVDCKEDVAVKQTFEFDDSYKVLGHNKFREGNLFHYNGITDIYKVSSTYSELKGSSEHKLWAYDNTLKEFGWKKLKNISCNDWVNVQYNQQVWGNNDDINDFKPLKGKNYRNYFSPKKLTPDICYLLGLYISEGSAYNVRRNGKIVGGGVTISCGDDISEVFKKLKLKYKTTGIGNRLNNWCLVQLLEYLGFDVTVKAPKKRIPERLFSCSKENIAALLQGMFDGDGSSNSTNGNVSYVSRSEELINQTRILLLNFGCLSCKYKVTQEDLNKNLPEGWYKFTGDCYSLNCYGVNALSYYKEVGFRLKRKQSNLKKLNKNLEPVVKYSSLPGVKQIVDNLYELSNTSPWKLATYEKIYIPKNENHGKEKVNKLIDIIVEKKPELYSNNYITELQDKVLINNSVWSQVKKIETLSVQEPVFDFSLPHDSEDFWCHSVFYNGILGHQTPKGNSGWYFDQYTNAEENGWNIIEAHWSEHPDYKLGMYQFIKDANHKEGGYVKFLDEGWPKVKDPIQLKKYGTKKTYPFITDGRLRSPWYDFESKRLGVQKTRCELDCSFAGSGSEVIDAEVIRALRLVAKEVSPLNAADLGFETKGLWRSLKIYKEYNPENLHILSSDVGTGDGSDYSTIVVMDLTTKEVVTTYKEHVDPIMFAKIIKAVAVYYGQCMVMVEYQGPGLTVLLELKNNLKYSKLYYATLKKAEPTRPMKRKIGFWQGQSSRLLGGDKLEECLNNNLIRVYSEDVISELDTWIWDTDGKRRHAPGKHDDLLMALSNLLFYIYYVLPRQNINKSMMANTFERILTGSMGDNRDMYDYSELMKKTESEEVHYYPPQK